MAQFNTPDGRPPKGRRRQKQRNTTGGPIRYRSDKQIDFQNWIIPVSAILTGTLVGLAAPQLVDASGITGAFKVLLVGAAAGFVSGIVSHYAIRDGAPLAATGFKIAGAASLITISVVGGSAAIFSYSGLVLGQVNELALQEHGQKLNRYIEAGNSHAAQTIQMKPIIDAAAVDIQRNLDCEARFGCLSNGRGGKGPTYRAVLPLATRASEISSQLKNSEKFRKAQLAIANKLAGEFRTALSDREFTSNERWQALARMDARIKQEVSSLREGVPLSLFRGYGAELENGIAISGQRGGATKVNAMLRRHGASINSALDALKVDKSESPSFPSKAGVSQAFERFSHFWPIGILTIAIEMLIPITLWIYIYLSIVWRLHRLENPVARDPDPKPPGAFDVLNEDEPRVRASMSAINQTMAHDGTNPVSNDHNGAGRPKDRSRRSPKTPPHHLNGGGHVE